MIAPRRIRRGTGRNGHIVPVVVALDHLVLVVARNRRTISRRRRRDKEKDGGGTPPPTHVDRGAARAFFVGWRFHCGGLHPLREPLRLRSDSVDKEVPRLVHVVRCPLRSAGHLPWRLDAVEPSEIDNSRCERDDRRHYEEPRMQTPPPVTRRRRRRHEAVAVALRRSLHGPFARG